MRRLIAACLSGLVLAAAAGCGGSGSGAARSVPTVAPPVPLRTAAFGQGAARYWIWYAPGKPRAVVLFLHGLDYSEIHPANHLVWIEHLARKGDDVIYPAYEAQPGQLGALRHTLVAVNAALDRLERPGVPFVIVGYSRGGRLAVELAALTPAIGLVPAAVESIFPSRLNPIEEEVVDLGSIDPSTRIVLTVGEEDSRTGAQELLDRLRRAGFPASNIQVTVVRSTGTFKADHFSAFQSDAEAQRQLWAPLDRLIGSAQDRR